MNKIDEVSKLLEVIPTSDTDGPVIVVREVLIDCTLKLPIIGSVMRCVQTVLDSYKHTDFRCSISKYRLVDDGYEVVAVVTAAADIGSPKARTATTVFVLPISQQNTIVEEEKTNDS